MAFITAGFPKRDSTVPLLLALEAGGADIIELGVPFSDPIADGPVIQAANTVSAQMLITDRVSPDPNFHRWRSRMKCITLTAWTM